MIAQDTAPYLSDFKTKRDWATAKRIFLKSDAWKIIRIEVFKKYGKRCVKCGSHSRIEVDHIKPVYNFPTLRLDLNNLQPLCHECNSCKGISSNDYRPKIQPEGNVSSCSGSENGAIRRKQAGDGEPVMKWSPLQESNLKFKLRRLA